MAQEYSEGQLAKLHSLELEILDAIAAICESHNIAWFLDSGTALGAVRVTHDFFRKLTTA